MSNIKSFQIKYNVDEYSEYEEYKLVTEFKIPNGIFEYFLRKKPDFNEDNIKLKFTENEWLSSNKSDFCFDDEKIYFVIKKDSTQNFFNINYDKVLKYIHKLYDPEYVSINNQKISFNNNKKNDEYFFSKNYTSKQFASIYNFNKNLLKLFDKIEKEFQNEIGCDNLPKILYTYDCKYLKKEVHNRFSEITFPKTFIHKTFKSKCLNHKEVKYGILSFITIISENAGDVTVYEQDIDNQNIFKATNSCNDKIKVSIILNDKYTTIGYININNRKINFEKLYDEELLNYENYIELNNSINMIKNSIEF